MKIKICGIRNLTDASIAIKAGANAVGFLVGITHIAEDKIDEKDAQEIIRWIPPFISSVMVTHLTDKNEIMDLATKLNVSAIQIHDYISPNDVACIRNKMKFCKIIKAVHVLSEHESIKMAREFEIVCDALLLDSRTQDRIGGTGLVHDWNISKKIISTSKIPVILAGGLSDLNVYEAVKKTVPYGVDVNSGVEIDGWKNYEKVKKFITEATQAEHEYCK